MANATQVSFKNGSLIMKDANLSPTASMWDDFPWQAIRQDPSVALVWEDHFLWWVTAHGLTSVLGENAMAVSATAVGGVLEMVGTGGHFTDEDECYLGSTDTAFKVAVGKDIWFETRVKITEGNTDDQNCCTGLSSVYAANTLVDVGAGMITTYDGIGFYKVDGGTVWNCITSQDVNQTKTLAVANRVSGSWVRLGFKVTSNTRVDFYVDGVIVATHTTNLPTLAMGLLWGMKLGGANDEKFSIDWFRVAQLM